MNAKQWYQRRSVHRLGSSNVVPWTEDIESLEQKRFDYVAEKKRSLQARYFYGIIFLVINLSAWFVRDYGQTVLPRLHYLRACGNGGDDCFHTLGVLRVSLGCFIFFFLMFVTTIRTTKLYEARSHWHSRWWGLKSCILIISMAVPFLFSGHVIQLYGELARIGAGVFLILQLVSVVEFTTWWNNYWMPDEDKKASCSLGLFMSTVFYVASICGIVLMYPLYAPRSSCYLNIFFISWTALLLIVMMAISLHSKVNRGLLSSGIVASYIVFLCWSAIRSEPASYEKCNRQKQGNGHSHDWITILSFLFGICATVMATFSTGVDSQSFKFRKDEVLLEDDIPYKYGFFHLVFSLGAMYFAMLFISWNLNSSASKWRIDVGWASTWVKIVNEWFAATVYLWKLISPIVMKTKVMNQPESVQQRVEAGLS